MSDKYALELVHQASDALAVAILQLKGRQDQLPTQESSELSNEIEMIRYQLQHLEASGAVQKRRRGSTLVGIG